MYTRNHYLAKEVSHHDYYAQFLTEGAVQYVVASIGEQKILNSTDPHFNDIPLTLWDRLHMQTVIDRSLWLDAELSTYNEETQKRRPFIFSMASNVCLAKCAARIFKGQAEC